MSIYPAVFAYFFSSFIKKTHLPALLIGPVLWVVLEFLRSYAFTGFPWSSIGYSQYKFLHIIQICRHYRRIRDLISCARLQQRRRGFLPPKKPHKADATVPPVLYNVWVYALAVCILLSLGYGLEGSDKTRPRPMIKASVVQGSIEQDKKWDPEFQKDVIDIYRDLSLREAA